MKNLPVTSFDGLVRIACAASPMIDGLREPRIAASPPRRFWIAAVAMVVRGHRALTAMPSFLNSPLMPRTHIDMPNFAIVYATCGANHRVSMLSGGEMLRMCGFWAFLRCGMHACEQTNVPRVL